MSDIESRVRERIAIEAQEEISRSDAARMAQAMHDIQCKRSHTFDPHRDGAEQDICRYRDEENQPDKLWDLPEHKLWMEKAVRVLG